MTSLGHVTFTLLLLPGSLAIARAQTPLPDAIAAPGEAIVLTLHAEGAQVDECKPGSYGKPAWAFREPIATLMAEGKTVGRHYAGQNRESSDGSTVVGKAADNPSAFSRFGRGIYPNELLAGTKINRVMATKCSLRINRVSLIGGC